MRPYWLVLLVACSTAEKERADYVEKAREETDWSKKLELLEMAVKTDGINLDSRLLLAETYLVAFNEPEKARDIYLRVRKRSRPRGFHGLGRCALFEGQEEVGRDYLRQSLEARPSVRCAIDLAARVGDPERARILAMPLGGRRWEFFRAAQGAASLPEKIPDDPSYALARARMAQGEEQDRVLSAHLADSCANDGAKQAYARFLLGQTLFARNLWLQNVVKEGD
ncbi:MAG: tetratricopeptide repeat protein [Planctomycetota bacterium]|jgi:hypothetical protein